MRIGELSERTKVPAHQLRYYESQRLLHPVRGGNGYRVYGEDAEVSVIQIRKLLDAGLSAEDIRFLQPCVRGEAPDLEPCAELLDALRARRDQLDAKITTLAASRDALDALIAVTECNASTASGPGA